MKIHSIFESISGEVGVSVPQGMWCTFIRLQGCNLRCSYCDTKQSQLLEAGKEMAIEDIVKKTYSKHVIITGGEPLHQSAELCRLVHQLSEKGHIVQIETNGSYRLNSTWPCSWVVDYKGPSSGGMQHKMIDRKGLAVDLARCPSVVKFVVSDEIDLYHAVTTINVLSSHGYEGNFAVSPANGDPSEVNKMIKTLKFFLLNQGLADRIIVSLQLHKICNLV